MKAEESIVASSENLSCLPQPDSVVSLCQDNTLYLKELTSNHHVTGPLTDAKMIFLQDVGVFMVATLKTHTLKIKKIKAYRPCVRDYLHTPSDYLHTDKLL